jgi:D-alanyl-D-alanine carboxypeptidase (penicillin-binding protein 5/6)
MKSFIYLLLVTIFTVSAAVFLLRIKAEQEYKLPEYSTLSSTETSVDFELLLPEATEGELLQISTEYPQIDAEYAVLYEPQSGQILYGKNFAQPASFASIVKVLSALTYLSNGGRDQLNEYYSLPGVDFNESQLGLPGREFTGYDILNASIVISANDGITALADSFDNFPKLMQQKAEELNLNRTFVENPVGYDSEGQKSVALDLVVLGYEASKDDLLANFFDDLQITVESRSGEDYIGFNTNKLLERGLGVDGIKTGTTADAGQCVLFSYTVGDKKIYGVVLNSSDRFTDAENLIEWSRESFIEV